MTAPPASARRNYLLSALIAQRAAREALKVRKSFTAVLSVVLSHQMTQARSSEQAVAQMLRDQAVQVRPDARLRLSEFTTEPVTLDRMLRDAQTDQEFQRIVASITQDAARAAESVSVAVRPNVAHVRFVNLPCCSRCAILAGRVYRWSDGFQRHPGCFPAGTVVSGPAPHAATRRWYQGELVVIRTASGKQLTATANHPILTPQGWLPANLLTEGGHVLSRTSGDRSGALLVPNQDQVPSRIEDVWSSDGMGSLSRVPVAAEDFHGDGLGSGEVDVVFADGLVGNGQEVEGLKHLRELSLAFRVEPSVTFNAARSGLQLFNGLNAEFGGPLSGGGLQLPLLGSHSAGAEQSSLAWMPHGDAGFDQSATHDASGYAVVACQRVLTLAADVLRNEPVVDRDASASRWDAPSLPLAVENRAAYASSGLDLAGRLASEVTPDRIVEFSRSSWSGHVFNLTSSEGWYDADGLIVSNCDCSMIPTTVASPLAQDPDELARSGQVRGLSKADLQALNDGADLGRIVNVRSQKAGLLEAGHALRRGGRPTPAGIYRAAEGDRDVALRLLAEHRYIA